LYGNELSKFWGVPSVLKRFEQQHQVSSTKTIHLLLLKVWWVLFIKPKTWTIRWQNDVALKIHKSLTRHFAIELSKFWSVPWVLKRFEQQHRVVSNQN